MKCPFPILLLLVFFSACGNPPEENAETEDYPPNVLLIMTDDQGYGDLSLHGNDSLYTPVLDQLAAESVQFDRFYVSPVCAPTRASLLTGRYHLRTGVSWVTHRREVMRTSEVTLAEYLKEAGYRTGLFGKWHNGSQFPNDPIGQGFDEFVGFSAGHWNNYFDTHLTHNQSEITTQGYITDVLTDSALAFIRRPSNQPFFCYVPYNAPHSPFQVPDRYFRKHQADGRTARNASVYGMVENVDENVGRLLDGLDELGLTERTIVIFLTDNGPNGDRFNGGMRGRKGQVHEGGVRVPCFMRWPGHLLAGRKVEQIAAHIDILPTVMELTGLPLDTVKALDGRSLVPLMTRDTPEWEPRALFHVHTEGQPRLFPGAMRTARYRLVVGRDNSTSLFDMQRDPGERRDIADSLPERADSLRRIYETWFMDVSAEGFEPPPIPIGYPQATRVELPAPEARLVGSVAFKGGQGWANDYIVGWKRSSDKASWPIYALEEGEYRVQVAYTCTEDAVGRKIVLNASGEKIESPIEQAYDPDYLSSPDRVERQEVYEKDWKLLDLGTVHLEKGLQDINLRIDGDLNGEALEVKALFVEHSVTM